MHLTNGHSLLPPFLQWLQLTQLAYRSSPVVPWHHCAQPFLPDLSLNGRVFPGRFFCLCDQLLGFLIVMLCHCCKAIARIRSDFVQLELHSLRSRPEQLARSLASSRVLHSTSSHLLIQPLFFQQQYNYLKLYHNSYRLFRPNRNFQKIVDNQQAPTAKIGSVLFFSHILFLVSVFLDFFYLNKAVTHVIMCNIL